MLMLPPRFFPNRVYQFLLLVLASLVAVSPLLVVFRTDVERSWFAVVFASAFAGVFSWLTLWANRRRRVVLGGYYTRAIPRMGLSCIMVLAVQLLVSLPLSVWLQGSGSTERDWAYWMGAVCVGPLLEEWIFRGVLLRGLLMRYRPPVAILLSAGIFALCHGLSYRVLPGMVLGVLFGMVFYRTRSLVYTMTLHVLANTAILVAEVLGLKALYAGLPHVWPCLVVGVVLSGSLFIFAGKYIPRI